MRAACACAHMRQAQPFRKAATTWWSPSAPSGCCRQQRPARLQMGSTSFPAAWPVRPIAANTPISSLAARRAIFGCGLGTAAALRPSTPSHASPPTASSFRTKRFLESRRFDMDDKLSTTCQLEFARRDFLKGMAAVGAAMALPSVAAAAETNVITGYGVTTAQLKDWSIMEKSTGLRMQFSTVAGNDIGALIRDVISSNVGNKADLVFFAGGSHNILGPRGLYAVLDEKRPELSLWERTGDTWQRSSAVVGPDGKKYGVPVPGNADSFGYFPDKIGASADGQQDISWQMLFENERTRGRAAFSRTWNYSAPSTALYLKASGKAKIDNPADLTGAEAKTVVDFLIERKKAGQFKTLITSYEEQVQLLASKEVDIANCWEPATRDANKKLGDGAVRY